MARNQRRRAQEALFSPAPSTTPPDGEKAAERTETALNAVPDGESRPNPPKIDPNGLIFDEYGIAGDCTNVPQILKAILCELVRRRV